MGWIWTTGVAPLDSVNVTMAPTTFKSPYTLKAVLKQAGWTVPMSSDGLTYNSTGDQIAGPGTGAGGWKNEKAWARLRAPDGSFEMTLQWTDNTTMMRWRIKLSLAGFTSGTPTVTQTPYASDEYILLGSGTDAAPGYGDWSINGGSYFHVGASTNYPYPFYLYGGIATDGTIFMRCPLLPGSYVPEVVDPAVTVIYPNIGTGLSYNNLGDSPKLYARYRAGLSYAQWTPYRALGSCISNVVNPYNGLDDLKPMQLTRSAGDPRAGWFGILDPSMMCWRQATRATDFTDYVDVGTTRYVYAYDAALVYPQSVIPLGV
jgi:hypothetical protein